MILFLSTPFVTYKSCIIIVKLQFQYIVCQGIASQLCQKIAFKITKYNKHNFLSTSFDFHIPSIIVELKFKFYISWP